MFKVLIGDLFASKAHTLVNTVNCVGIMGTGVAAEFKKAFPGLFDDYARRCEQKSVKLGQPYLYRDLSGTQVVNFPTKGHWRTPSRLSDIEEGLDYLVAHLVEWEVESIALPPLGCGNGGLDWADVGPLIYRKLRDLPIDVEVYAPYGTPTQRLTVEFLAGPAQMGLDGEGRGSEKLNENWVALMEVLRELEARPDAHPVGRSTFERICYVITELGVPTGLKFKQSRSAPFSNDVTVAVHTLANRNWLTESRLGQTITVRVGPAYQKERNRFTGKITEHQRRVTKTADLFSRIKSNVEAEVVVTVLLSSRKLKQGNPAEEITEQQIFDFILKRKRAWDAEGKRGTLATTIRSLVVQGWMKARISESMLAAA